MFFLPCPSESVLGLGKCFFAPEELAYSPLVYLSRMLQVLLVCLLLSGSPLERNRHPFCSSVEFTTGELGSSNSATFANHIVCSNVQNSQTKI